MHPLATPYMCAAPIHWAVLVDASESAQELITVGADPTLADRDQRTPLHWAADRASEKCLKLLLQTQLGDSVDAADWGGYSALHYAARRGAVGCVKMLLSHGASRRLVAMNGELATDLTSCDVTKALLTEQVGMKRQRSLSSANSIVLFSVLPDLAKQFYEAWSNGDVSAHVTDKLRATSPDPQARLLAALMTKHAKVSIEEVHVCTKTSKVVVELTSTNPPSPGGTFHGPPPTKAMHSLAFTEDGLVSSFVPYGLVEVTAV